MKYESYAAPSFDINSNEEVKEVITREASKYSNLEEILNNNVYIKVDNTVNGEHYTEKYLIGFMLEHTAGVLKSAEGKLYRVIVDNRPTDGDDYTPKLKIGLSRTTDLEELKRDHLEILKYLLIGEIDFDLSAFKSSIENEIPKDKVNELNSKEKEMLKELTSKVKESLSINMFNALDGYTALEKSLNYVMKLI